MTSDAKPVQLARLGWLARQANLLLHGGLHLKSSGSHTQTWIALGKLVATYNFAASLFWNVQSILRTFFRLRQLAPVLKLYLCCKNLASNGPNNKQSLEEQSWQLASTTSTLEIV